MRAVTPILAISLLVPFAGVQAQGPPSLAPGTRIRVTALGAGANKLVGTFVGARTDTLLVRTRPGWTPQGIPLASVTRLDASRGRKSKAETGAIIGGLLLGGTVLIGIAMTPSCPPDKFCPGPSAADAALILTPIAVGVGAGIGAFIGSAIHGDRWEEVPLNRLRVSVMPQRDGRVGLGLSFAF